MRATTLGIVLYLLVATTTLAQVPIGGLESNGPDPALKEKLDLFGQFVGDWEFDMVLLRPDGTRPKGDGHWHFGEVLQGRAIQDVWIARDDVSRMLQLLNRARLCASMSRGQMRGMLCGLARCGAV